MKDELKKKLIAVGIAGALPIVSYFEGTKLTSYLDPISKPTICRGHTQGVKLGQTATLEQCDAHTVADLLAANAVVNSCVTYPLQDHERAGFVSFAFNVGRGAKGIKDGFCVLKNGAPSTLITKLNQGDVVGACKQMLRWTYGGDEVLKGLVLRRKEEVKLCLGQPLGIPS